MQSRKTGQGSRDARKRPPDSTVTSPAQWVRHADLSAGTSAAHRGREAAKRSIRRSTRRASLSTCGPLVIPRQLDQGCHPDRAHTPTASAPAHPTRPSTITTPTPDRQVLQPLLDRRRLDRMRLHLPPLPVQVDHLLPEPQRRSSTRLHRRKSHHPLEERHRRRHVLNTSEPDGPAARSLERPPHSP